MLCQPCDGHRLPVWLGRAISIVELTAGVTYGTFVVEWWTPLKAAEGSGRELGEDKEGIWIRVSRLGCDRLAWEDSRLPSLRTESQVESSGKCYPLTTN